MRDLMQPVRIQGEHGLHGLCQHGQALLGRELPGEKAHEHCGQCPDFPCRLLRQFAYDPQQGDDGLRIEQCRKWNGEA